MRSIDTSLLAKIQERNQTHWNDAQPIMSVQVSRASTTVTDSSYWTVEKMREGEDLGDTSVAARRFKPYGPPNRLYNIYVQSGAVKTATREYPDYSKQKWQDQFSLGSGSAVAIAFDGHWELYRKRWQLVTDEEPFLFWVDSGKLFFQHWDQKESKTELATGVSKVKALRGWKNVNFPDRDMGVVCAYIKSDGKVYYRNYCVQTDGKVVWELEREISEFTGSAINLNLFISNDYRTGIVIEDALGKINWLLTERNWAGMAIATDRVLAYPHEIRLELVELDKYKATSTEHLTANPFGVSYDLRYTGTSNNFVGIHNVSDELDDWGKVLIITTLHRLYGLYHADFEIVDASNRSYIPDQISEIENNDLTGVYKYRLDYLGFNNFNNVGDEGILKFKGLSTTNGIDIPYDPFEKVVYLENLEPTETPLPEVEAIWNE